MDGLLIIDKPEGLTSHDVVARVRRILKTKRVGHTGTLDPFATGVLVLLIGKATRLAQFLDKDEKEYEAVIKFGFETDTGDRTGVRTADYGLSDEDVAGRLRTTDWEKVLNDFRGEIEQVPPMYSAKKQAGKKLYELARKGIDVERQPIKVTVTELEVLNAGEVRTPHTTLRIRVVCSAGTYIRTLAEDIGRRIGIGAHLIELRRIRAGKFNIAKSTVLGEIDASTVMVLPIEEAVSHLPQFCLEDDRVQKTRNGLTTRVYEPTFNSGLAVQMTDKDGRLVAIGAYEPEEKQLRPRIVFI